MCWPACPCVLALHAGPCPATCAAWHESTPQYLRVPLAPLQVLNLIDARSVLAQLPHLSRLELGEASLLLPRVHRMLLDAHPQLEVTFTWGDTGSEGSSSSSSSSSSFDGGSNSNDGSDDGSGADSDMPAAA